MKIINEYTAEFNMYGDTEKIVIAEYPNGKFYIHYGWMENHNCGACVAGGFDSLEEAEKMLMKHRPTARKI